MFNGECWAALDVDYIYLLILLSVLLCIFAKYLYKHLDGIIQLYAVISFLSVQNLICVVILVL